MNDKRCSAALSTLYLSYAKTNKWKKDDEKCCTEFYRVSFVQNVKIMDLKWLKNERNS